MKKNILTVVIMAATIMNLILTAVLVFSVMPAMNKTSNLVDKVASVIDLEISGSEAEYSIQDLQTYAIEFDKAQNINLQKDAGDDRAHYASINKIVVSFNSKAEDFADVQQTVQTADVYIQDIVKETVSQYTATTVNESVVREEAVKKIQEKYGTKCIVDISLPGWIVS